jgi:hypothetical protein
MNDDFEEISLNLSKILNTQFFQIFNIEDYYSSMVDHKQLFKSLFNKIFFIITFPRLSLCVISIMSSNTPSVYEL